MHSACTPRAAKCAPRDLGIFGRDADVAPAVGIVLAHHLRRLGHRQAALADAEVDRRVDLRIVELQQHVVAGDAELRRAERDEGRDVEAAHADDRRASGRWSRSAACANPRRRKPAPARCPARASSGISSRRMRPFGNARTKARPFAPACIARRPCRRVASERVLGLPLRRPGLAEIAEIERQRLDLRPGSCRRRRTGTTACCPSNWTDSSDRKSSGRARSILRLRTASTRSMQMPALVRCCAPKSSSESNGASVAGRRLPSCLRRAFPAEAVGDHDEAALLRQVAHLVQRHRARPAGRPRRPPDPRRRAR